MYEFSLLTKKKPYFIGITILTAFLIINFASVAGYSMQAGQVTIDHEWTKVQFQRPYNDPVVVAKPLSYNGGDPATVRIRNLTPGGFEIRVQEWDYLEEAEKGAHNKETVSYLVMEAGHRIASGGLEMEGGKIKTDAVDSFIDVKFSSRFSTAPVVITSVITENGGSAVVTRNQNVTSTGFELTMQEQEANEPQHNEETISYIAWEPGEDTLGGRKLEVGTTGPIVDENFTPIDFGFGQSITVQVDEEESANPETGHAEEDVGYIAFAGSPLLFIADMQTYNGGDTANLRYGGVPSAPEEEEEPPSAQAPKGIIIQPPEQPKLNISISTDRPNYPIGSSLGVSYSINEEAYIYVLHYDTQGVMRLIFPNQYSQNNLRGPGTFRLPDGPYQISVNGPPGTQYIQAVASTKQVEVFNFVRNPSHPFSGGAFPVVPNPQALIDEIKSGLSIQFYWKSGEGPGLQLVPVKWDSAMTSFQVTQQQVNIKPSPDFVFSPTRPNRGENVNFDASGSHDSDGYITQYLWDFDGDGRTDGSGMQVSNRYWSAGQYNVKLTVRDNQGATNSITKTIRIGRANQPPIADFNYSPSNPLVGERVTLDASNSYDPDGSVTQYLWDFDGDGRTDASGRQVTNRFWSVGRFQVKLTVKDNEGASSTSTKSVQVSRPNEKPTASFDYTPTNPAVGDRINFDASKSNDQDGYITQYQWDFDGDGRTDASGRNVTHIYRSSGQYRVELTVRDNDGATDVEAKSVSVQRAGPQLGSQEADSFSSTGDQDGNWYWNTYWGDNAEWRWNTINNQVQEAYINFHLLITDNQGASGLETTLEIRILNSWGSVIETGEVELSNPFKPQFSGDTNGVGYDAYGSYQIRNTNQLSRGFRVVIEWPPADSRYRFGATKDSALLAYIY